MRYAHFSMLMSKAAELDGWCQCKVTVDWHVVGLGSPVTVLLAVIG